MSEGFSPNYAQSGIERTLLSSEERDENLYGCASEGARAHAKDIKVLGTIKFGLSNSDRQCYTYNALKINIPNAKQVSAQGTFRRYPMTPSAF